MKNDLSCGVARDLMPLYAEGLAGEESREALERHTAQCPACAARLAAMTAPEEPVMEEPEREVDYLKTIRRKTKGRMILAVVCTLLVLAALWGLRVYVIGAPADREAHPMSFGVHTHPAEETLDLRILAPADAPSDAPAYWDWETTREGETVFITARQGRPSPIHPREEYTMTIDVSGVKEVYLCGVLLWQDDVTLTADAQSVYACRTPYVGNPSALGRLSQALVQAGRLPDGYTMELQTSHTPYRWTLCYRAPASPAEEDLLNRRVEAAAPLLLALVNNLGEIAWSYPGADGETVVHTLSQDRLSEILGDLAGGDIKACAQSPGAFQKLWNRTDAWLYGES